MTQLYVSESTVAKMLGHTIDWLRQNSETLERQFGFPKMDPATGKRHAPSIEKWAEQRNDVNRVQVHVNREMRSENIDQF